MLLLVSPAREATDAQQQSPLLGFTDIVVLCIICCLIDCYHFMKYMKVLYVKYQPSLHIQLIEGWP